MGAVTNQEQLIMVRLRYLKALATMHLIKLILIQVVADETFNVNFLKLSNYVCLSEHIDVCSIFDPLPAVSIQI